MTSSLRGNPYFWKFPGKPSISDETVLWYQPRMTHTCNDNSSTRDAPNYYLGRWRNFPTYFFLLPKCSIHFDRVRSDRFQLCSLLKHSDDAGWMTVVNLLGCIFIAYAFRFLFPYKIQMSGRSRFLFNKRKSCADPKRVSDVKESSFDSVFFVSLLIFLCWLWTMSMPRLVNCGARTYEITFINSRVVL